jgi:hypothetical protein
MLDQGKRPMHDEIGAAAGVVWGVLDREGRLTLSRPEGTIRSLRTDVRDGHRLAGKGG